MYGRGRSKGKETGGLFLDFYVSKDVRWSELSFGSGGGSDEKIFDADDVAFDADWWRQN